MYEVLPVSGETVREASASKGTGKKEVQYVDMILG